MGLKFPRGSHRSILTPKQPASRLAVAAVVMVTCAIGASGVYVQIVADQAADQGPMRTARAVDAPSAVVSSAFQRLTAATGRLPQPEPSARPVTDRTTTGVAPGAPARATVERAAIATVTTAPVTTALGTTAPVTTASGTTAPVTTDAKSRVPKTRPAQTKSAGGSTTVQVYTLPDGQQVSVHRPVKSGDSIFDPWSGFENAAPQRATRPSRRIQLARPGQVEPPFGSAIISR